MVLMVCFVISRVIYGYPSVHSAGFSSRKSYGPVRCGFEKVDILRCGSARFTYLANLSVRLVAVVNPTVRFGAAPR